MQVTLDDDLADALVQRAADLQQSKAALIRLYLRRALELLPALREDPLSEMIGIDDFEPADIDDVAYG